MKEIQGLNLINPQKYHNEKYYKLMKKVVPLRTEFTKIKDSEGRKQMAKEEFDAWHNYLLERKADLPSPDFVFEEKDKSIVREIFDRNKVSILISSFVTGQKDAQNCIERCSGLPS